MKVTNRLKGKGLIRSLNRRGAGASKSPRVAPRKGAVLKDPSVCERCGAVYAGRKWRHGGRMVEQLLSTAAWVECPACVQAERQVGFGRVLASGDLVKQNIDLIRHRIVNVERRAGYTQPERRVIYSEWDGTTLEVLTTSQKLAHRIVRELEKLFGGHAKYHWSQEDGSLFATWQCAVR